MLSLKLLSMLNCKFCIFSNWNKNIRKHKSGAVSIPSTEWRRHRARLRSRWFSRSPGAHRTPSNCAPPPECTSLLPRHTFKSSLGWPSGSSIWLDLTGFDWTNRIRSDKSWPVKPRLKESCLGKIEDWPIALKIFGVWSFRRIHKSLVLFCSVILLDSPRPWFWHAQNADWFRLRLVKFTNLCKLISPFKWKYSNTSKFFKISSCMTIIENLTDKIQQYEIYW